MPSPRSTLAALMLAALAATCPLYAQPRIPATSEQEAIAALKAIGGVFLHYDDRHAARPVVLVDFSHHQGFQPEWLLHLAAFDQLTSLGLSGISVTDNDLRYLADLAALETLSLVETQVSDEGLVELIGLGKLRHLDLRGSGVTAAGVRSLQKHLPELQVLWGEMDGDRLPEEPAAQRPLAVSAVRINALRQQAAELSEPAEDQHDPEGWSKSSVDPARLVELFEPLRLRDGYVLRAYVFREEGNGNGVVWALPEDAEFPEPADCPALDSHMLKAPKPADALDDAMEAIEGDGSAAAYLAASLLRRELREFGALWHGCAWRTHHVLDDDPWKRDTAAHDTSPLERPTSQPREWTWIEPRPTDWAPRVHFEADRVTVTFYTYSGLQTEAVYRHVDTYWSGKYRPKVAEQQIGKGPDGYVF